MKKLVNSIGVWLLVLLVSPSTFAAENSLQSKKEALDVRVTDAFFYVPLGASKTTMAFFTLTNYANVGVNVVAVNSQAAKQLRLMPEATLSLPPKQTVSLKSSGRYVQINELKTRLSTGDELQLELTLSNGQTLNVIAVAKSAYDQVHSR